MKTKLLFAVILIWTSGVLGSPTDTGTHSEQVPLVSTGEGPMFWTDYANFQGTDHQTYVEFYIQVGYDDLQFIKHKDRFSAGYDIHLIVLDEQNNLVRECKHKDIFEVDTYSQTQDPQKCRVSLYSFNVDPAKYKFQVLIRDIETLKSSRIEGSLMAPDFDSANLSLSNIQLSQKIAPATTATGEDPFIKNGQFVEPNPGRVFAHGLADMFIYFEVYNLNPITATSRSTYTAQFTIYDPEGQQIAQQSTRNQKPGTTAAHCVKLPIETIPSGRFKLVIDVRDDDTGQVAQTSTSFTIVDMSSPSMAANLY